MASGREDWSQLTVISGKYGTSYLPVLLDSSGQLFAVFKGTDGTSYIPIKLDADGNLIARIQGYDGTNLVDAKVDSNGQLYVRIMGLEGANQRQLAVDASGRIEALMKGVEDSTVRTLAVDASGYLIALLKGDAPGGLVTLAADDSGFIKVNLSGQGLDYLKVRPTYGKTVVAQAYSVDLGESAWTDFLDVAGKGAFLGGYIFVYGTASLSLTYARIVIDGAANQSPALEGMIIRGIIRPGMGMFYCYYFDPVEYQYGIGLSPNLTFEETLKVSIYNNSLSHQTGDYELSYALVP